ncbi:MAG: hypothetical protein H0V78_03950 [Burkholderiales bacterium]|nr:hypothetical protein [Burkholderiales bacterium]
MNRRRFLRTLISSPLAAFTARGSESQDMPVGILERIPRPIVTFTAGQRGLFDVSRYVTNHKPGVTKVRLRANVYSDGTAATRNAAYVPFQSQFPEYSFGYPMLHYDGSAFPASDSGASAARVQIEATDTEFGDSGSAVASSIAYIHVDSAPARIKHGLEEWSSFDALTRAVRGDAAPGSAPSGRTDLIGKTFEITPGMFSGSTRAAATIQFPCTIKALDPNNRPVFRNTSGERDIIQVHAIDVAPIDGEVVLQDLVIRDNRGWYNTGEAGVRIKDRFAGRSVRVERCEFARCQNAVSGGAKGQTLRIYDCRVVDCGYDDQAHSFYVSPEWLEFFGNVVSYSPGNRLARAHQLKTRALNAKIFGNKFLMNDCAASYLIDISNGGDYEIGGNVFQYGPASDNRNATLVAFAPEGSGADYGPPPYVFSPGRRFRLTARNNTMISDFAAISGFFVIDNRLGPRAEGGTAATFPDPLVLEDNVYQSVGPRSLVIKRDRAAGATDDADLSSSYSNNSLLVKAEFAGDEPHRFTPKSPIPNTAGRYATRRFTGATYLGTGSAAHVFATRGAV